MENNELSQIAKEYEEATNIFIAALEKLSPADLDKPKKDGWSARQVIHHLADSEAQSCARIKRLIAEPGSVFKVMMKINGPKIQPLATPNFQLRIL
jgi:uncharacterized damage-inducible protein DinB